MQSYMNYRESGKPDTTKGTNKAIVINPKGIEIYESLDKEFKIIILKKLNEMKENMDR